MLLQERLFEDRKPLPANIAECLLVQVVLTLPVCVILAIGWHSEIYLAAQLYPLCVFQGLHFLWVLWSWRRVTGHLFSAYTLFFIAVEFFNGGECLLEIFGLNTVGVLGQFAHVIPAAVINKSVALTTAGMACIHLGALLGAQQRIGKKSRTTIPDNISAVQENLFVKSCGWLFFSIGAAPAVYSALLAVHTSLSNGYLSLFQGRVSYGFSNFISVTSLFCAPGLLMLLTAYSQRKAMVALLLCFIAFFCLTLLIAGDRGTVAMLFLATLWLFHFRVKKIPASLFVVFTAAAFIICPVVDHMRQEPGMRRFSPVRLTERMVTAQNPLFATLQKMGWSLRTVPYTIMVVPAQKDFMHGCGYLWTTTTICPNLFWPQHPALKHTNYAAWLTNTVHPDAGAAGGVGFSLFAEMYLNFSWFGTPLACIVLGFMVGNFSAIAACRPGPMFYAFSAILISILPYFARGSSQHVIRPLFWFCVFPYVAFQIWLMYKKTHSCGSAALSETENSAVAVKRP